jgi:26S proteasome regulatory subunit T4
MIMATNWPDVLDHALLCPGCLDQKIEIPLPNEQSRTVINIHAAGITKHREIDYESIVKLAEGFNGADLQNVCAEAGSGSLSCSVSSHVVFSENLRRKQENEWNV